MEIRLSEKHGVNPTIPKCFFCGEDKNEVILMGKLKSDAEAPRGMAFDQLPCDKCAGYMKLGIILISVDEEKTDDMKNPWRTGGWVVIKANAVARLPLNEGAKQNMLEKGVAFISDELWDLIELPRISTTEERS